MTHISFPCCEDFGSASNLGENLNDTFEFVNTRGFSTIAFRCNVPTGGVVTFEATYNGTDWEPVSIRSITDDIYTQTTDNGSDFIGSIAGARRFRWRTSGAGSAPGTIMGKAQRDAAVLEGIEFGYPPHRFGFLPVHKDATFTTAQTGTSIWTPATGKRFVLTDIAIFAAGVTDAIVTIYAETDAAGSRIFPATLVDVSNNKQFSIAHQLGTPYVGVSDNDSIKITTSADIDISIIMHGYEI